MTSSYDPFQAPDNSEPDTTTESPSTDPVPAVNPFIEAPADYQSASSYQSEYPAQPSAPSAASAAPGYGAGTAQPGYDYGQSTAQQNPYGQPGYDQAGYQTGYTQPGYQQAYQQPGYQQPYAQPGYAAVPVAQQKSKVAAGILGIFLGALGVHNFYLGRTGRAVAQLLITILSLGFLSFISGIWGLVEGILILTAQPGDQPWGVDANNIPLSS